MTGDPTFKSPPPSWGTCAVCVHDDVEAIEKRMRSDLARNGRRRDGSWPEIGNSTWSKHRRNHLDNPEHAAKVAKAAIAALMRARNRLQPQHRLTCPSLPT